MWRLSLKSKVDMKLLIALQRMFSLDDVSGIITTRSEVRRDVASQVSFVAEVRDIRAAPATGQQTATGTPIHLFET